MGRVDFLYPKEVQTKSSINGGPTTYTVGGVIHKQDTDKLSPGRLDNIKIHTASSSKGRILYRLLVSHFHGEENVVRGIPVETQMEQKLIGEEVDLS